MPESISTLVKFLGVEYLQALIHACNTYVRPLISYMLFSSYVASKIFFRVGFLSESNYLNSHLIENMQVVYRNHLDRFIARVVHVLCVNVLFNYLSQQNFECNDHK